MNSVGRCSHCGVPIRAGGVLRISRRTPYTCAVCHGVSVIAPGSGMRVVLGWFVSLALLLAVLDSFNLPLAVLSIVSVGASIAIPLIFARFCRFESATPIVGRHTNGSK